jgi:hypothetical protein
MALLLLFLLLLLRFRRRHHHLQDCGMIGGLRGEILNLGPNKPAPV